MATDIAGTQRTPQGDLDQRNMSFSMGIWLASGSADIKGPDDLTAYLEEVEESLQKGPCSNTWMGGDQIANAEP